MFGDRVLTGRALAVGDGILYDLPVHAVMTRAIRAGQFPGWNPFEFGGQPLMANSQVGVFYPPNWLFLIMGLVSATDIVTLSSFAIAGVGTFLLARRWSGDIVGALVAGIAFSLSGFMVGQVVHPNLVASIAWLPWALLGFDLTCSRFTIPRVALGSGAVALSLLAGHAQMYMLIIVVLLASGALIALFGRREDPARTLGITALIVVLGVALSAVQLVPILAIHGQSSRTVLNYASATSYSYPWSHLSLLMFPYLFGNDAPTAPFTSVYQGSGNLSELSAYPGLAVAVLACAGLGSLRRDRRLAALGITGVGCAVVALGASTPVAHAIYSLPVANEFRAWGRYMVVFDLVVALLAANGVAVLRLGSEQAKRAALVRAGVFVILVILLGLALPHLGPVQRYMVSGSPERLALLFPMGAAVAGLGVCFLLARRVRLSSALIVVVVLIDLVGTFGAYAEWHAESFPRSLIEAQYRPGGSTTYGPPAHARGGIDRVLIVGNPSIPFTDMADATDAKGIRSINGYDPLAPSDYLQVAGAMDIIGIPTHPGLLWPPRSHVLDLLRVTTILQGPYYFDVTPPDKAIDQTATSPPSGGVIRYYYTPRLPDAFVVGATRIESRLAIVNAVWGNQPFDPSATALVEARCKGCVNGQPGADGAAVASWSQDGASVHLQAERPGMLVVSQSWFPGWHATVDGRAAPVVRVDGLIQGVPVPAGTHFVQLFYRPPGLALGAWMSGTSICGLLAAGVTSRRLRRRSRHFPAQVSGQTPS
ncbi:MAG TPA: YfhO family protein [Acidimicrobiales bacterium]|nr:YfhO family protein [Acidimicrobiales bacterium]